MFSISPVTKNLDSYKMYIADIGLFVTLMFIDRKETENDVYAKLLSDKLPANLGYLYENAVAQMITASDRELYYYTWKKKESTHYYEIDFLISNGTKVSAIEVKSSIPRECKSIIEFRKKYSANIDKMFILSQKDIAKKEEILNYPIYMLPYMI